MTNIILFKKNNNIVAFEVSGHSGYDDFGKDIVCSAISSITQTACIGINEVLMQNAVVIIDEKKGYLKLSLPKLSDSEMEKSQIILRTMEKSLTSLLGDYGKYLKMEVKDDS